MSIRGRWRVVETPGYDMALAGAYILFDEDGGEFAIDCLTGSLHGACDGDAIEFGWRGNDEWSQQAAMAGLSYRITAHSKVKSASSTATTSHSSHVEQRLLQQPASGFCPVLPTMRPLICSRFRRPRSRGVRFVVRTLVAPIKLQGRGPAISE